MFIFIEHNYTGKTIYQMFIDQSRHVMYIYIYIYIYTHTRI